MKRSILTAIAAAMAVAFTAGTASAEADKLRIAKQYGLGYVQLMIMEDQKLIEKHAKAAGLDDITVEWSTFRSSDVMNDALISGNLDFASLGPTGIITIWSKTRKNIDVRAASGLNAMAWMLNVRDPRIKSIRDFTDNDRIAVPAVKVSGQATALEMAAAKEWGDENYDKLDHLTVSLSHPDATAMMLAGESEIVANFSSPPYEFVQLKDPKIRTILTTNDVMGSSQTFTMLYMTAEFREKNPKSTAAILAGLEEANAMINADKKAAAEVFLDSVGRRGWTAEEIIEVLNDPDNKFTTTPENVMTYANFMADIGTLKVRPASWKDLFFPEIHNKPGS